MGRCYTQGNTDQPLFVWQEGDWTLEVFGEHRVLASKIEHEARAVVTLLNQYLLPPHMGVGVVEVAHKGPITSFEWQQGGTRDVISTYIPTPGNARDVIRMAASWHVES